MNNQNFVTEQLAKHNFWRNYIIKHNYIVVIRY